MVSCFGQCRRWGYHGRKLLTMKTFCPLSQQFRWMHRIPEFPNQLRLKNRHHVLFFSLISQCSWVLLIAGTSLWNFRLRCVKSRVGLNDPHGCLPVQDIQWSCDDTCRSLPGHSAQVLPYQVPWGSWVAPVSLLQTPSYTDQLMTISLAHVLLPSGEVCKEIANQVERDTNEGDSRSFGHSWKCKNNIMPFLYCSSLHSSPTNSAKFWHKHLFFLVFCSI